MMSYVQVQCDVKAHQGYNTAHDMCIRVCYILCMCTVWHSRLILLAIASFSDNFLSCCDNGSGSGAMGSSSSPLLSPYNQCTLLLILIRTHVSFAEKLRARARY